MVTFLSAAVCRSSRAQTISAKLRPTFIEQVIDSFSFLFGPMIYTARTVALSAAVWPPGRWASAGSMS